MLLEDIALALAFVFLGEPLSATQIIGAVLVLTGLVLIEDR